MYGFGWKLTPAVKWLIGINVIIFLSLYLVVPFISALSTDLGNLIILIVDWLALNPQRFLYRLAIWQPVTYMFLHADIFHILFNMLALWMFGGVLEEYWGKKKFLIYYFLTGTGAGITYVIFDLVTGMGNSTIGASGAIYGLLLAFGVLFPDTIILMFFLFPMKAKYAVMIFAAVEFLSSFQMTGVAHIAHLGGMIFGLVYIKYQLPIDDFFDSEKKRKKKIVKILQKQEDDYQKVQLDSDKILEKISREGIDKITAREREILDKASKLLKERERNIIDLDNFR